MSYAGGRYNRSPSCVYVGNLPDDIAEKEIKEIFHRCGRIRDIDIKRGRTTNGTAYCFIEFESPRDAEDAVERRNNYMFDRNRLRVEFTDDRRPKKRTEGFSTGPPHRTEYRVIVKGLPVGCRWQHLKDHMRRAGDVGYANVEKGYGIVEYVKYEGMMYALEHLHKTELAAYDARSVIKVYREDDGYGGGREHVERKRRSRSISSSGSRYSGGRRRGNSQTRRHRGSSSPTRTKKTTKEYRRSRSPHYSNGSRHSLLRSPRRSFERDDPVQNVNDNEMRGADSSPQRAYPNGTEMNEQYVANPATLSPVAFD